MRQAELALSNTDMTALRARAVVRQNAWWP
jgi:hypothetical protein